MPRPPIQTKPAPVAANTASHYAGSAIELLTKVVLLGGPVFYVLGRIYLESYWSALDVAPSIMAVDAEDYIYLGFIVIASGLVMLMPHTDASFVWLAPLASLVFIGALGACIWMIGQIKAWIARKLRYGVSKFRVYLRKRKPAFQAIGAAAETLNAITSVLLALLLLSAALLFPIVLANSVGKWHAGKVRQDLRSGIKSYPWVIIDEKRAGRLLECSQIYCIAFDGTAFSPVALETLRWIRPSISDPNTAPTTTGKSSPPGATSNRKQPADGSAVPQGGKAPPDRTALPR